MAELISVQWYVGVVTRALMRMRSLWCGKCCAMPCGASCTRHDVRQRAVAAQLAMLPTPQRALGAAERREVERRRLFSSEQRLRQSWEAAERRSASCELAVRLAERRALLEASTCPDPASCRTVDVLPTREEAPTDAAAPQGAKAGVAGAPDAGVPASWDASSWMRDATTLSCQRAGPPGSVLAFTFEHVLAEKGSSNVCRFTEHEWCEESNGVEFRWRTGT